MCTTDDSCVPGNKYTCTFGYGDIVVGSIDSTEDRETWGIGSSIMTVCGATDAFGINL